MQKTSIIKRGEDYIFNEVDGELVMMNMNTGLYVSTNETGKDIWDLLAEPQPVNYILEEIQKMYNVSAEQCEADVLSFMDDLENRKIIVETSLS